MRVVLDTNLIVRAAGGQAGLARELLSLTLDKRHTLVLCKRAPLPVLRRRVSCRGRVWQRRIVDCVSSGSGR